MAVRSSPQGAGTKSTWFVAASLLVLFVAALFLRAYWNLDAANPSEGEFILSGGSDPYYHKRAVDAILADGDGDGRPDFQHHLADPLLNYPRGSENPNPPLYQWSIAVAAFFLQPLLGGDLVESAWQATIWSPAIFGALTIIPVYFIGAALFDRRAGLVAALLWTVSTSAVDAGGLGLADHDAAVLFFVTLSFLFYIQTIRHFRGDGNWVVKWSDGGAISRGLAALFRERRAGFAYALLAAVSISAVALTWKGFNYVIGILFVYGIVQMIVDHWRNRDSTGLFLGTLVAIAGGILLALPYYTTANVGNFLQPTWYILAAFVVGGLVLVPTRDLPTILVLPIAAVAALILGVFAFFVFPDVAQSLLYATVYFKQTRLYETIAEAHPADFSTIAFGVGPLAFFLALAGWVVLLFKIHATTVSAWTRVGMGLGILGVAGAISWGLGLVGSTATDAIGLIVVGLGALAGLSILLGGEHPEARTWIFAILWGAVAVFMANSAVRFLINAIPVFCVFAGYMAIWVLDWVDFGAVRRSLAANKGNAWQGLRRGVRPLHIVSVILIALLFVFPTTILAADAALPPEAENKFASESDSEFVQTFFTTRMGAYGQGFGQVRPWIGPLQWLDQHDANITDLAKRPAFLSWWDYGHWAIAIGRHPAVADNFQNGYEFAANFILSQNESHAIQLLASRIAEAPGADLETALRQAGSKDAAADAASLKAWKHVDLSVAQSAELLAIVETQTGKSIRYFATDIRMLPYDNPQSPSIEAGSIFYAPVTLKGDETDEYVTTQVNVGTAIPGARDGFVTLDQYRALASDPIRQYQVIGERYLYQEKFANSAYWRHYVGTPIVADNNGEILGDEIAAGVNNPRPAYGLEHFRAVHLGNITRIYAGGDPTNPNSFLFYPEIVITEYYRGAIVEGTVVEDGVPQAGVAVTVFDDVGRLLADRYGSQIDPADFNVPHAQVTTDAEGKYRIVSPFALPGGNVTLVAQRGNVRLGAITLDITREDAQQQRTFTGATIEVQKGSVTGRAYRDLNFNGRYDEGNDTLAPNVTVALAGRTATTDANGVYTITDVPAGVQTASVNDPTLQVSPQGASVRVEPGAPTAHDLPLVARSATVSGRLVADLDGDGNVADDEFVPSQSLAFTADPSVDNNTARTVPSLQVRADGNYTATIQPGSYFVTGSYTHAATNATFRLNQTLVLGAGEERGNVTMTLLKQE